MCVNLAKSTHVKSSRAAALSTEMPMQPRQGGAFDEGNTSEERDTDDLEEYDEDADNFSDEVDEMEKQAKRLRRLESGLLVA